MADGELTFPDGRVLARLAVDFRPAPAPAPAPAASKVYGINIALLILSGLALSIWLARYTQYFSAFGTALGLGGVFVWMTFLGNLLREDRKKQMLEWFDRNILSHPLGTVLSVVFLVFVVGAIVTHGAVVLISREDGTLRTVSIKQVEGGKRYILADDAVTPQSKLPLLVGPLFGEQTVVVRLSGLPPIERTVGPMDRIQLLIPGSFNRQPVALIRMEPNWTATAARYHNWFMEVTVRRPDEKGAMTIIGKATPLTNYDGRTIWVGCDDTVEIPKAMSSKWTSPLPEWTNPTFVHADVVLRPRDVIDVVLKNSRGRLVQQSYRIPPRNQLPEGVMEIYLQ